MSIDEYEIVTSEDPEEIREIARRAIEDGLFRPDGIARDIFEGKGEISKIVAIYGIAWAMRSKWKESDWRYNYFTKKEYRRRGIATRLQKILTEGTA